MKETYIHHKRAYKRHKGFLLAADIGHEVMRDVEYLDIKKLTAAQIYPDAYPDALPSSQVGFIATMRSLYKSVTKRFDQEDGTYDHRYGVHLNDRIENSFEYKSGLADQEFTWHFAPVVAVNVIAEFQRAGYIDSQTVEKLTLGDYADMIAAEWFKSLMHDFALTGNGVYGGFGNDTLTDYKPWRFNEKLKYSLAHFDITTELFDVERVADSDGMSYLTASLSKDFRGTLRAFMKESGSVGCPVARRAGTLSLAMVNDDVHAQRLVTNGDIKITDYQEDKVRFSQEYTPIDRALDAIACQLDRYSQQFGNPHATALNDGRVALTHDHTRQSFGLFTETLPS